MKNQSYDIIGDIHGHAAELETLLIQLGYNEDRGHFNHPEGRKVIFLGDYIDRGPEIRRVLQIVRGMIDAGEAHGILGNHEINALRYHTKDGATGKPLRANEGSKTTQHIATLKQLAEPYKDEWQEWLDWFSELPLWLELPGLRAVHASWSDDAMDQLRSHGSLKGEELIRLSEKESPETEAIERILNGLELKLPEGEFFKTPDGRKRTEIRSRWWDALKGMNCSQAVFPDDPQIKDGAFILPEDHRAYPKSAPLIFFGHYAVMTGEPKPLAKNIACLDYGMAKGGQLVAYRWDGEATLDDSKFISIPQRKAPVGES
jgi:diadenosine tetraphosphatase ApaH/serine/threonine PP2A family protein phosphatase